jgi:MSHA pilin protein MshC
MRNYAKTQNGFTLIELVMVIVLIGILSYGSVSLFASRDAYSGYIAKSQLISIALLAQQIAMGMSATVDPVNLVIERDTDDVWNFTLTKTASPLTKPITSSQESSGSSLIIDGVTLAQGDSKTFIWNSKANLTDGQNHEIRFSGNNNYHVCLSSSGYAYESQVVCP